MVDGASWRGCRRAFFVTGREQPDVAEQDAVETVPQPCALATEHVVIPGKGGLRINGAEMDVVGTRDSPRPPPARSAFPTGRR